MNVARILILGVALAAGGAAASLVAGGDPKKPEAAPAPVAQFATPDVLIARSVTLELAPRQAETLTQSRQLGTLSLALRSLLDASKVIATDINTVPFGVSAAR